MCSFPELITALLTTYGNSCVVTHTGFAKIYLKATLESRATKEDGMRINLYSIQNESSKYGYKQLIQ